jgi:hypothetical protein
MAPPPPMTDFSDPTHLRGKVILFLFLKSGTCLFRGREKSVRRPQIGGRADDEWNRISDEQSPRTVIYPLVSESGYGTICGIGLTGVTQQIVIASLDWFQRQGAFVHAIRSVGPFPVPGTVRFMLGCAADATRLTESNGTGTFGGLHGF